MEQAKRARTWNRGEITKVVAAVETELAKDEPDFDALEDHRAKLESLLSRIVEHDQVIAESLLSADPYDEEAYSNEMRTIDEYQDKANRCIRRIRRLISQDAASLLSVAASQRAASVAESHDDEASGHSHKPCPGGIVEKKSYKLPKIELQQFSGDLSEWLGWWAHFQTIHEDKQLTDSMKFTYLLQALPKNSKAYKAVSGYPRSADNYQKAVDTLKERFGRKELLQQLYIRELIKMVIGTASSCNKSNLSDLYVKIQSHIQALESLDVACDEQAAQFLFPMVESCLSEDTLTAWQRLSIYNSDVKTDSSKTQLERLLNFLKQEVENEERRNLARNPIWRQLFKIEGQQEFQHQINGSKVKR